MVRCIGTFVAKSAEVNTSNQYTMADQTIDPTETTQTTQSNPNGYLVRYNTTIVGIYDTESDATDALNAYQMDNTIDINDTLDILNLQ